MFYLINLFKKKKKIIEKYSDSKIMQNPSQNEIRQEVREMIQY